jgi:uncharacterized protein (TIGR03437 family)
MFYRGFQKITIVVLLLLHTQAWQQLPPATSAAGGGQTAQVSFAGARDAFAGLDQVNVLLPRSLAGSGAALF